MNKIGFQTLSHRDRWDKSKKLKNVDWYCEHCGDIVDGGKLPKRLFMGEQYCGSCHGLLTRRTGGGQSDPFNFYPLSKGCRKINKKIRLLLKIKDCYKGFDKDFPKGVIASQVVEYNIKTKDTENPFFWKKVESDEQKFLNEVVEIIIEEIK